MATCTVVARGRRFNRHGPRNQNIENNPMHSSPAAAGMADPATFWHDGQARTCQSDPDRHHIVIASEAKQ